MQRAALAFVGGWLLVGQPWVGVNAWEDLQPMRRKPFRTQEACEGELARQRDEGKSPRLWKGARCVTVADFQRYPRSRQAEPYLEDN